MPPRDRTAERQAISFPQWKEVLAATDWPEDEREGVRRLVLSFLRDCKLAHRPVTAEVIRSYLARLDDDGQREGSREALRWFYTLGSYRPTGEKVSSRGIAHAVAAAPRSAPAALRPDHPGANRDDLGGPEWERDLVRATRERGLLWRTETTYRQWAGRFVRFLGPRSPYEAETEDVARFLSDLATIEGCSPATQKQALNALVFFLQRALQRNVGDIDFRRARRRPKLPVVLAPEECRRLFVQLDGTTRLMAELAYGAGLRVMELLRLRVQHLDLEREQVQIYAGKGGKHRVSVLPGSCVERLREHLERLRGLFERDRAAGLAGVWLPEGLERKYPRAGVSWECKPGFAHLPRFRPSTKSLARRTAVRWGRSGGNGCFPRGKPAAIRRRGSCADIMCWMVRCKPPSNGRPSAPDSTSA